ncbi:hypothetical protein B0H15DRAFT_824329 [Mycena belliarum]|uniref:Uncharacterized protein n=1 Tax=Mycena belliarum TaxID=1033014 RepID=A0AAD6UCE0_9AGAR|nr:hypothetical protein B0H15DRAFT_824329 [Mycena belliae]
MPPSSPSFTPSFQIRVVPPAEDRQPDYLVFNADSPTDHLASPPDVVSLDAALTHLHSADPPPVFHRDSDDTVVMPRRSAAPEADLADETVRDDSEIVEVVKVRRACDAPQPPPQPKPKSLRSRATSAFRSIKNVARSSSRNSRPYAQDVFASTEATFASVPPPPPPPPLARRGSLILTHLFRSPSPAEPLSPSSTLDFLPVDPYLDDDDDDNDDDDDDPDHTALPPRAPSPSPSTLTFSSTVRRRLSIFNFQRKVVPTLPSRPSTPPTLSRGSTLPSAASSAPQTPIEESYPLPPQFAKAADDDPDCTVGEMRLDSLHFESLSFDVDNF